jgi:RNA polymerase sigma-70 factor (ECF subfamily)
MWPEPTETNELLLQAGRGETAAVNQLLDRHRDALRRVVELRMDRKLGQRVDASDIVQDVMLEASQRLADYVRDPKMPFKLWLRHLAMDRVIEMHRHHRVAARRSLDREQALPAIPDQSSLDLLAQLRDQELTPAAATIRRELEQRFLAAVEQLDDEDREIVLLRHVEHLSNSEAADLLGLTPPAAGMRHLRALRRLRTILGESSAS